MKAFTMNTKKQGDAGMALAVAYYASLGATVAIPLTDSQDYDILADVDGKILRVQVKTTKAKSYLGTPVVKLTTCGGNRSWVGVIKHVNPSSSDVLFVSDEFGRLWAVPVVDLASSTQVTLSSAFDKYRVTLFKEYVAPLKKSRPRRPSDESAHRLAARRKFNPSKETLEQALSDHNSNFCALGRLFGVSDNAVRKRCRLLGVSF